MTTPFGHGSEKQRSGKLRLETFIHTAIDKNGLASHEGSALGGKPNNSVGDVFRLSQAADRNLIDPGLLDLLFGLARCCGAAGGEFLQPVCRGISRSDVIGGDAILSELVCEATNQAHNSSADGVREHELGLRLAHSDGTDSDHPPPMPTLHVGNGGSREGDGTAQIQRKSVIPFLIGRFQEFLGGRSACIRDANIKAPERIVDIRDELLDGGAMAYVEGLCVYLDGETIPDGRGDLVEGRCISRTKRDVSTLGGECESSGAAQTLA